jgi:hypothetical protein
MLAREHIPFFYVISRIYVDKARLETSLWVLSHNPFVKREFAKHREKKMQRKNA